LSRISSIRLSDSASSSRPYRSPPPSRLGGKRSRSVSARARGTSAGSRTGASSISHPSRDLGGQPGLARAARADQCHQPAVGQQLGHPGQLRLAPDEAGQPGPQVALRAGLAAQDRRVQRGQFGRRIDAKLVGQGAAQPLVLAQRLSRPPGLVQCPDQQRVRSLPQRVRGRQIGALGHHSRRGAALEVGVDAILGGGEPRLVEPGRGRAEGRDVPEASGAGDVDQRRPAPQGERLAEQPGRDVRVAGRERLPAGDGEPLELDRVDVARRQVEPVPDGLRVEPGRIGQQPAQPGHQGLQRARRAGRRGVRPDRLDQRVRAHHPAGIEDEPDQQGAQPAAADLDGLAVVAGDQQRAEHPDTHRVTSPCGPVSPVWPRTKYGRGSGPARNGQRSGST
jgi:hypothetical protein